MPVPGKHLTLLLLMTSRGMSRNTTLRRVLYAVGKGVRVMYVRVRVYVCVCVCVCMCVCTVWVRRIHHAINPKHLFVYLLDIPSGKYTAIGPTQHHRRPRQL